MVMPTEYRKSSEAVASFDFSDIASGLGYQAFNLAVVSKISGAAVVSGAIMTDQEIPSQYTEDYDIRTGSYAATKFADYDFDTGSFKLNRTIKGTAIVQLPFMQIMGTGTASSTYFYCFLYRVRSGTETLLVSGQTVAYTVAPSSSFSGYATALLEVPESDLMVDDKLRLAVEFYSISNASGGQNIECAFGHDAADNDWRSKFGVPITAKAYIPFKIDL